MFGNYIKTNSKIIQKKVYSKDYKHKYLITVMIFSGKVVSKSKIEISENSSK